MNENPSDKERRIIPRWKFSKIVQNSRETCSIEQKKLQLKNDELLFIKKLHWETKKNIDNASEFLESVIVHEVPQEGIEAASYLVSMADEISPKLLEIAKEVLFRSGKSTIGKATNETIDFNDRPQINEQIHKTRLRLKDYPRNSLLWVDLAQAYTILGDVVKSKSAIKIALSLAPNNRFVLRSAARFYLHIDEPDAANQLLLRREVTKSDPWLLSAEIATASVEGKNSNLLRLGKRIIDDQNYAPFHLAELSSAIATVELNHGSIKLAKRYFNQSLIDPNENTVAQSIWAKKFLPGINTENVLINTPRTYEAKVWSLIRSTDWNELLTSSRLWQHDEPFSSRPAEVGSYVASVGLEDYKLAEVLCNFSLVANPNDLSLINNLAFALANQGKLAEALSIIKKAPTPAKWEPIEIALNATEGLIKIRMGNIKEGENLYKLAIETAERKKLEYYLAMASIYYAREMYLADAKPFDELIQFTSEKCVHNIDPVIDWLFERLKKLPDEKEKSNSK